MAKAVIECYKNEVNKDIVKATDFKMYQGKGVRAEVGGIMYYAGNGKLMSENNIAVDEKIKTQADKHINQGSNVIFAAIILAITGVLNPVVGALVHNAGSVLVITNSALLLKWKRKTSLL